MSEPTLPDSPRSTLPPNEQLPPVEPPSPGFLVQLVVIPAVIVTIIVLVWTLFTWLAQKGNDVDAYLVAIQRENPARWQAAVSLADLVRTSGPEGIRTNAVVAQQLQEILSKELQNGRTDESAMQLRSYLCNALGEFRVPNLLPVLIAAAGQGTTDQEAAVRFAALKSIAVYLEANPSERVASAAALRAVIDKAAQDEKPLLRSTAAFAYSVLESPEAVTGLERLLHDANPDVRYNAALNLARRADPRAIDVILEMLEPTVAVASANDNEDDKQALGSKRVAIHVNALRTLATLAPKLTAPQQSAVRQALKKLIASEVPAAVQAQATETLAQWQSPASPPQP